MNKYHAHPPPKAGEADELKMASNCTGDMLMPKSFYFVFHYKQLDPTKKT